ncbi:ATP-binding cassette domain-containing protein [Paenibacillus glufosinatiresistens]|uniref:ATP-binding cassette domain-containing protein n=1 Tax=Paenibacillus glufosinatiresistens TaxID=3070657 RepID=UPI00286DB0B2|nr:ATP-binding cassette domain-containing protein [Paenibacillus sp. YX.27]
MAIELKEVSYTYADRTLWKQTALHDIDLKIPAGSLVGIAGTTGSGKSTLLQLFNGILRPSSGSVTVLDVTLQAGAKPPRLLPLRRRVGLVFQFPEHQMFAETVEKDLLFGPLNFGMDREEAGVRIRQAMNDMGLPEELLARSPFRLSGGQMRKAAIASVLAADPEIVILDEPTATLDPVSRDELVVLLVRLCREQGKTVVVVTHRMDELLPYADQWVLLGEGRVRYQGDAAGLAAEPGILTGCGLAVPQSLLYWRAVAGKLGLHGETPRLTPESLAALIAEKLGRNAAEAAGSGPDAPAGTEAGDE